MSDNNELLDDEDMYENDRYVPDPVPDGTETMMFTGKGLFFMVHRRNPNEKRDAFYDRVEEIAYWLESGVFIDESDMRFCFHRLAREHLRKLGCLHLLEMQAQ